MSRTFKLIRYEDVSGVSGLGCIAEGVLFSDGHVALHWLGEMPMTTPIPQLEWLLKIHGHNGKTRLVWDDQLGSEMNDFTEKDTEFLRELIDSPDTEIWKLGARRLLRKVRFAMKRQIPQDNPVRT